MSMKRLLIYLSLTVSLSGALNGAESGADNLSFSFQRGLDYYRWGSAASDMLSVAGQSFRGQSDVFVMLRQPPGFPNQWKTSINLNALWSKPMGRGNILTGSVGSEFFSDQQVSQSPPFYLNQLFPHNSSLNPAGGGLTTGLNNRILRQSAGIGIELQEFYGLNLLPQAGIYGEKIMGISAVGPTGNIAIEGSESDWGGFQTSIAASANGQFLHHRTHREITTNFRAWKEYSPASSNLFTADYRNYVREFPLSADITDRRYEEEYRFGDNLKYNIFELFELNLNLNLARRRVEPTSFDATNRLDELSTGLSAGISGRLDEHLFSLAFTADGQNQSYPFRTVKGRQYGLSAEANFSLKQDSLKFSGMLSRYKYDISPEEYSIDTRDEIRHSYKMIHYHPFGEGLEIETQLRTDFYHLVYLKASRSADNNWERFFLFSPEIRYESKTWSQRARFRVSADYIDYDFEASAPPSRVFRKFSAEDSLYINIAQDWGLKIQYLLLLEDGGILDWDAFIQELSDKYHTNDGSLMFFRRLGSMNCGIGWAYYHRKAYHTDSAGELSLGERVESLGPITSVYGNAPYGFQVEFTASYRRIRQTFKAPYSQTMIDLTLFKSL